MVKYNCVNFLWIAAMKTSSVILIAISSSMKILAPYSSCELIKFSLQATFVT